MTPETDERIRSDAIRWHVRLRDGVETDWDAFTVWLEEDASHRAAYDTVARADAELDWALLPPLPLTRRAANDDAVPARGRRRLWLAGGGAMAATLLVGTFILPEMLRNGRYEVTTAPGEQRTLDLGAGSRVALNGSSRITLDRKDRRFASLESGEATFVIRHDPDSPFALQLGNDRVQDAGTTFNVVRDRTGQTVEVAEGAIVYNPQAEAVPLHAGQALFDGAATSNVVVRAKDPAAIGSWRNGRLDYRAAPISVVTADLSRTLGIPITVTPTVAARLFTGTVVIDRNPNRMFARLSALLDVDARLSGDVWILSARGRAAL